MQIQVSAIFLMQTFLERAAAHVVQQYPLHLERITVVLPTNRACFFFRRAMAFGMEQPAWSPRIVPIDDLIKEAADAELVEPIGLLWQLYDVCKAIDPNVQFDRFTSWAHPLLQDFDKIDQYLVNTRALFDWLSKAKTIERWQPDAPANRQVMSSLMLDKYFKLWENLEQIYVQLKAQLQADKKAYRGMLYRQIAENPDVLLTHPDVDQYVFIGLNALSQAEETLLQKLVKHQKAELLWDTDAYYMECNQDVKAGDLLRRYKREGRLGAWNWQTDELLTGKKDVHIVGVPNSSMQAKVAAQLHVQLLRKPGSGNGTSTNPDYAGVTAIVLPDENLLLPVMQSLGKEVQDFNITMGLSLRNASLFTLVNLLFELQQLTHAETNGIHKTPRFNHRHVVKVLTHPFIRQFEQQLISGQPDETQADEANPEKPASYIRQTLQAISERNLVFLSPDELQELGQHQPLFEVLFTPWHGNPERALRCFTQLIDVLRGVYRDRQDAIEVEYLYLFSTIIRRLEKILLERSRKPDAERLSLRSFKLFLYELLKQTKIPFTGEPVSQLQIMGMLETRTLDFENVIILSANEKTLPQAKKQHSLIPLDASLQFGMPTYRSQEATMSYHFYRLLQRARRVYLLHVLPSDTYGAGEKSRFVHQIEHELAKINPNLTLHPQTARLPEMTDPRKRATLRLTKTPELVQQLTAQIAAGISPSQLNTYVACSLQYYFNYLAGLEAETEVQEKLDASSFGNLVHYALEKIDQELAATGKPVYKDDLSQLLPGIPERVRRAYGVVYPGHAPDNGLNYLLVQVAVRVILNFLNHQIDNGEFPVEMLGSEKRLSVAFTFELDGKPIRALVTGRIDRLDKVGNTIRIIDYKTGNVEKKHLTVSAADVANRLLTDPDADKIRQLWLYKYLLTKRMLQEQGIRLQDRYLRAEDHRIISGIYSFRNVEEGLLTDQLSFDDGSPETPESFIAHSEAYLKKLLTEMLNPAVPFAPTVHVHVCAYCAYKDICDR